VGSRRDGDVFDWMIRNVRIPGTSQLLDLAIQGGRFAEIGPALTGSTVQELEAHGRLVAPAFVEPHYHLDKCFLADDAPELTVLSDYLELEAERKKAYTAQDVAARAGRAIELLLVNGVTTMRSQVDVDPVCGLTALEGVLIAKQRYAAVMDIQLVAFPQLGICDHRDMPALLREAMRMGCMAIGGHPQLEISTAEAQRQLEVVFEIAREFDAEVDLHVDETDDPNVHYIHDVAVQTLRHNWRGRVNVGHVCSLALVNDYYAAELIKLIRRAGIAVIANPTSNVMFRAVLDRDPKWRGLTRVRQLADAGVNVCFGQETINSVFITTWRNPDPLITAQLLGYVAQYHRPADMQALFNMATVNAARALGLTDYGLIVGREASFSILDAENVVEALRFAAPRPYVFKRGRLVVEHVVERTLHLPQEAL